MPTTGPYFVKPAYRTKSGTPKFAIYYQAEARRMPDGKLVTPKAVPIVLASNWLDEPESVLKVIAALLNANRQPVQD